MGQPKLVKKNYIKLLTFSILLLFTLFIPYNRIQGNDMAPVHIISSNVTSNWIGGVSGGTTWDAIVATSFTMNIANFFHSNVKITEINLSIYNDDFTFNRWYIITNSLEFPLLLESNEYCYFDLPLLSVEFYSSIYLLIENHWYDFQVSLRDYSTFPESWQGLKYYDQQSNLIDYFPQVFLLIVIICLFLTARRIRKVDQ